MNRQFLLCIFTVTLLWVMGCPQSLAQGTGETRFGPFGLFDSRSQYGKGVYPEPFIVDDSDLEANELRLDWSHQTGKGQNLNVITSELEKGFDLLTLELEIPYEYDTSNAYDPSAGQTIHSRVQGFDNVNLVARSPFYQYVSPDELFDTTFGMAIEVGVPSNSPLGKNAEIVFKIFNDTRIGDHFTAQTVIGYSFLRGSTDSGGGEQHFEYGLVLGWTVSNEELPIPDVEQLIPVFEIQGGTLLNTHAGGSDNLTGNFAVRANLDSIGPLQPRLGLGFLLPLDNGARRDFRWGVFTSLVFEF